MQLLGEILQNQLESLAAVLSWGQTGASCCSLAILVFGYATHLQTRCRMLLVPWNSCLAVKLAWFAACTAVTKCSVRPVQQRMCWSQYQTW